MYSVCKKKINLKKKKKKKSVNTMQFYDITVLSDYTQKKKKKKVKSYYKDYITLLY